MPQFQMPPQVQQFADGLDHSQGKWFAPGEVLPPGFAPALHPEGATEPQAHHQMSDMAASQSFVMTGADMQKAAETATRDLPASTSKKSSKKKSKKKKSSGCC